MNLKIAQPSIADFNELLSLYRSCGAEMLSKGFDNWGDFHPSEKQLKLDIEGGTIFVLKDDVKIVGVTVLDTNQDTVYATVNWKHNATPIIVVHRLAVLPSEEGKGHAQKLMQFAEEHARATGMQSIRLDAYSINERVLGFYKKQGFERKDELINLGDKYTHLFNCFEKKM